MFSPPSHQKAIYLFGLLICSLGIFSGVKADYLISNDSHVPLTHKLVRKPDLILNKKDFLLIGLSPYLGRKSAFNTASDLQLVSAGKKLILQDGNGIIHKSANITIAWKKVPLNSVFEIARKVAGPFSSFESAQEFTYQLDKAGIKSIIAHPQDWEVWVSSDQSIPIGINMKLWTKTVDSIILPVLKGRNGEIVLTGPIQIQAPDGLQWNTGIYAGPFLLKPDAYGSWTFIEKVRLPDYLKGVVPHEIGAKSPYSALAAQAVLARTWALANSHRFAIDGYHLCSDTQCQVYKDPNKFSSNVEKAIQLTSGKFLTWEGRPINAVYHATNGGVIAAAQEAWSISGIPYLQAKLDGSSSWINSFKLPMNQNSSVQRLLSSDAKGAFGTNHYRYRWKRIVTAQKLKKILQPLDSQFDLPSSIEVLERGASGRVLSLQIMGSKDNNPVILKLDNIRRILRDLPSTLFVVNQLEEGDWEFLGGGFGHGVGLSQAGAIDLANRGWNVDQILMHYYPGTEYEILP